MNLKMLLTVYAVLMVGMGVPNLVVPSMVASLSGFPPLGSLGILQSRSFGALAIGIGVMCWTARKAEASKARDALILGLAVINGLIAVVALLPAIAGEGSLVVWADTTLWALLTVLFIVAGRRGRSGFAQ